MKLQLNAKANGGVRLTYRASELPNGLSLNSSSGLITGAPTVAGHWTVTVTASASPGNSATTSFGWTINPKPTAHPRRAPVHHPAKPQSHPRSRPRTGRRRSTRSRSARR